jgi:transposase
MQSLELIQGYFNPKQLKLPLSFEIKIPFDSEARTFDEVFRRIDFRQYIVTDRTVGRIGYNPVNMLKLILFCMMENITSTRQMEKAAKNDIRIMWLTDELKPSHQTINQFMKERLKGNIEDIFREINRYIINKEQIEVDKLYIDGTKIEANANKYKFVWKGSIEKFRDKLYRKITKQLEAMNERYAEMGIFFPVGETYEPETLMKIVSYLEIEIGQKSIAFVYGKGQRKTALQRDYEKMSDYHSKLTEYNHYIEVIGPSRNSCARTDEDATFMHMKEDHMRNGQLKAGYNIQIGVSNEYILHVDVFQDRSDYQTLIPFLEGYKKAYGHYPKYPVADAGYGGLKNYRYLKLNDMELYQKYAMYSKDTSDKKRMKDPYFTFDLIKDDKDYVTKSGERLIFKYKNKRGNDVYELPNGKTKEINDENMAYQKEVIQNLQTDLGIELRIQRSIQVEGAFGVIKENMGMRRFRRRGIDNVKFEFILVAIGYNLSKLHKKKFRLN